MYKTANDNFSIELKLLDEMHKSINVYKSQCKAASKQTRGLKFCLFSFKLFHQTINANIAGTKISNCNSQSKTLVTDTEGCLMHHKI